MLFLRLLGVLFRDVAKDLLRHRGQHLLAILTLASGLILAGGGLLAVESLDRWVSHMESQAKVTVFATEGGRLEETEGLLQRDPRFQGVRRITAQEGTRRFLETSREAGLILESLGNEPIPESLELTLRTDLMTAHKAVEVGQSLRKLPGVGDVIVDQQRLEALQNTARLVRQALSLLGLVLLVAAGFSTGNVIRMSVLSREEEISIMRLVGATESFIRTPMLVEGAVLGLTASLLTILALFGLWWPLHRGLGGISPLLVELARLGFFSLKSMLVLGFMGTITGALGALWGFWTTQRAQRKAEELMESNSI